MLVNHSLVWHYCCALIFVVHSPVNSHRVLIILCVIVCTGDGGKVGSAAFAGGGSRSRQSGAAQPAGGGEEVGCSDCSCSLYMILFLHTIKVRGETSGQQVGITVCLICAVEMLLEEM